MKGRVLLRAAGEVFSASVAGCGAAVGWIFAGSIDVSLLGDRAGEPARHPAVEPSDHRRPGLLGLVEGVFDSLLAGDRDLDLLLAGPHAIFGLRPPHELVRGTPL